MNCINDFYEETRKIEGIKKLIYEKIIDVHFCYEYDEYYDSIPTLYLSLLLKSEDGKIKKIVKSRYFNISGLQLRGGLYISGGLIMKDTYDKNGGTKEYRYYIHDDSGYGDDDGFKSIEFYCGAFKLVEVTDFI